MFKRLHLAETDNKFGEKKSKLFEHRSYKTTDLTETTLCRSNSTSHEKLCRRNPYKYSITLEHYHLHSWCFSEHHSASVLLMNWVDWTINLQNHAGGRYVSTIATACFTKRCYAIFINQRYIAETQCKISFELKTLHSFSFCRKRLNSKTFVKKKWRWHPVVYQSLQYRVRAMTPDTDCSDKQCTNIRACKYWQWQWHLQGFGVVLQLPQMSVPHPRYRRDLSIIHNQHFVWVDLWRKHTE